MTSRTGCIDRCRVGASLILAATGCVLLLACEPTNPESPVARYVHRLGVALSIATPHPDIPPLPAFAGPPQPLTRDTATLRKIDHLSVSDCALQHNLIKRSSSLGRHAKASQRLLIELEFLQLAPACIQRLQQRRDHMHAAALARIWQQTRAALSTLIFNATLGDASFHALWQPQPTPGAYPPVQPRVTVVALQQTSQLVHRWLHGDYRADNAHFEVLLSEIAGGSAGHGLQLLAQQAGWLHAAGEMLQQSCATPAATGKLPRTAFDYFTRELLPVTTGTWQRFDAQLTPLVKLEKQLADALPTDYHRWLRQREQRIAAIASAPTEHLQLLRDLRTTCRR